MAKLTPAQDKAFKAFGVDGEFPKGTRAATIEGIRTAGLIEGDINKGVLIADGKSTPAGYALTDDGRTYLGLESIATTVDEITELLDAPHGTLLCDQDEAYGDDDEINAFIASFGSAPLEWRTVQHFDRNRVAWNGLTLAEIQADIATAVPIGRAARRHAFKHNH